MVEFLKTIQGSLFSYEKGKRYCSMDMEIEHTDKNVEPKILVRQPNSPKNKNYWTTFSKSDEGVVFKTIDNGDMTLTEMIEENKLLEL